MFVVAMKTTRTRLAVWGMVLMALVAVTIASAGLSPAAVATGAAEQTDGVALLRELGYRVPDQWSAVREVAIPVALDGEWDAYQAMQTACGYDLIPYLGKRVKCYTYPVSNYPGQPTAQANLYEYEGRVIAGDIAATGVEGFPHGLIPCPEQGEANGATG